MFLSGRVTELSIPFSMSAFDDMAAEMSASLPESVRTLWGDSRRKDASPRVEAPHRAKKHQRRTKCAWNPPCALTPIGRFAHQSKAQINCLERMLQTGMPPRIQLENAFAGLRVSVADDIEAAIDEQWSKGVSHGQYIEGCRTPSSEAVKGSFEYREVECRLIEQMAENASLQRRLRACQEALSHTGRANTGDEFAEELSAFIGAEEDEIDLDELSRQVDLLSE